MYDNCDRQSIQGEKDPGGGGMSQSDSEPTTTPRYHSVALFHSFPSLKFI